jgi:hypothetical protein
MAQQQRPHKAPDTPAERLSKADWAAAKAKTLRDQAYKLERQPSNGNTSSARSKYKQVVLLNQEASRFEAIAGRLRGNNFL